MSSESRLTCRLSRMHSGAASNRRAARRGNSSSSPGLIEPLEERCLLDGVSFVAQDYAGGAHPRIVATADFNGDGKLDLAVPQFYKNGASVAVMLGDGNGGFGAVTYFSFNGQYARSATAADFNRDGKMDLAVLAETAEGLGAITLLQGNGSGGFVANGRLVSGSVSDTVIAADLDADGKVDLADTGGFTGPDSICLFLGNGSGGFGTETMFTTGSCPECLAVADFNGDHVMDLVTANCNSNTVSIFLGTLSPGSGAFQGKKDFPTAAKPMSVAVADFNGDGKLDLVTANTSDSVSVLLGDGTGEFGAKTDLALSYGAHPTCVTTGDFDGDGKVDLAVANEYHDSVSVLRGDGTGNFGPEIVFSAGSGPFNVVAADFNGDRRIDLVTPDSPTGVTVLLNSSPLIGDANADSKVDFHDYLILEQNFGKTGLDFAHGDLDGSGTVDYRDYLLLEQNFGKSIPVQSLAPTQLIAQSDTSTLAAEPQDTGRASVGPVVPAEADQASSGVNALLLGSFSKLDASVFGDLLTGRLI